METQMLRLGVDVGGTNTDAVLMRGRAIIGANKSFTSADVMDGVVKSVTRLLTDNRVSASSISHVMIGTTQFINAFIQRKDLVRTAIVRAALPRGDGVPPLIGWPEDLLNVIGRHSYQVKGGANYDGALYQELDEDEIRAVALDLHERGIEAVALSATYAPLRPDIEARMEEIVASACPRIAITRSGNVGGLNLVDRENAAIINASLQPLANRVVAALEAAFQQLGIQAPILISQNDGTLISCAEAARHPVFTCAAGPTNSIRGAAFLSGLANAVVIDVGGTTTDVGYVTKGFPKETALPNLIGGVRTNMRMPDVLSIALGGGTLVMTDGLETILGPSSVGLRLKDEARIFGGDVLTASDIAVAAGRAEIGDASRVADLDRQMVRDTMQAMARLAEEAIDRIKTSAAPVPAILVGGGHILLPDTLQGVSEVIRPQHAAVANAVGAAIATVSGRTDKIYDVGTMGRDAAVEAAKAEAISAAIAAGADAETIEIVEFVELPMTHIQAHATQIKIRAVGDLLGISTARDLDAA